MFIKNMKKILLVNFSISNGGDYLIEERMKKLFEYYFKYDTIYTINGYKTKEIDFNNYDVVILGGGPYFDDRIVKELFIPLFDFDKIKIPVHLFGCGIYGNNCSKHAIFNKRFNNITLDFFNNIVKTGGTLGCRDVITYTVMKNNGLNNVYLTGCPAWFDIDNIDRDFSFVRNKSSVKRIAISDPGLTKNQDEQRTRALQAISVIKKINTIFPDSAILFSFNNGIKTKYSSECNDIIFNYLKENNIEVVELVNSAKLFSKYNNVDLHIGFRVHSHIYSLSKRIPSILIEEDIRGFGMNETFGLPHLLSFDENMMNKNTYSPNETLCLEIESLINYFDYTNYFSFQNVFSYLDYFFYNVLNKWFSVLIR